ncbi:MAG: phenylacetate--CoA ligase family protein [Ruminococcus sp.]|nr:phenylacetate--CoA ligase family protein [Ruminococcus sp.]
MQTENTIPGEKTELESDSKHHYNDGETTEWSAVSDQQTGEATYCHRENYEKEIHIQHKRIGGKTMDFAEVALRLAASKAVTKLPRKIILILQQKRLRRMLRFAFEHSRYYRAAFRAAGISGQNIDKMPIERFPTIDKQVLIERFEDIITVKDITQEKMRRFDTKENAGKNLYCKYHIVHSSGSTGLPAYFLYDNRAWDTMLIGIIRAALWNMSMPEILRFKQQNPKILYIAAVDGRYGGATAVSDGLDDLGFEKLVLDVQIPTDELIKKLSHFKPDVMIGYPTAIKLLSQINELRLSPKRIITCGEPLDNDMRRFFRKHFGCEVINFYGASESIAIGVGDDRSDGIYLFDDLNYIEVADDGIYLTCLYNFVQPLIRYKIGDIVSQKWSDSRYPFSKLGNISGRSEDVMWFNNALGRKEFLHPLSVEGLCIDGLIDYQFVLTSETHFEIHIQTLGHKDINEQLEAYLRRILASNGLENVTFDIKRVNTIFADKRTGKKRLIVDKR